MEKITLKKLNDWFEHLDERNKIIALLSIDIDIKELNKMDIEELKYEIALPNDISLNIEWSHYDDNDKLISWLEFNSIKYNPDLLIEFIDTIDANNFSMLSINELENILSIEKNKKGFYKKEWLINLIKKGSN